MSIKEDQLRVSRHIRGTELYSHALQHTAIIITPKALSRKVESRPKANVFQESPNPRL
jgi:hypothetical protein